MKKQVQTNNVHKYRFRERNRFTNKTTKALPKRTISALDMCCLACFFAYLCQLVALRMTAWYAFQKSEKQCPLRYSSGILFHRSRHVSLLRSPTALATTCRVFLQRAIHIHTLFTFLNTNDHSSSNSRIVAFGSFGSGATSVSLKGGSLAAFLALCRIGWKWLWSHSIRASLSWR